MLLYSVWLFELLPERRFKLVSYECAAARRPQQQRSRRIRLHRAMPHKKPFFMPPFFLALPPPGLFALLGLFPFAFPAPCKRRDETQ